MGFRSWVAAPVDVREVKEANVTTESSRGAAMTAHPSYGGKDMTREPFIVRQGDVLLRRVDAIPAEAKPVARDNGRVILAYGEVTGHAHQIADPDSAVLLSVAERATFLRLTKKAQLVHEEHAPIDLAPGAYEVIHQREATPWGERRVMD